MVAVRWPSGLIVLEPVRDLYRARWGEPARTARFEVAGFAIEVLKWDADATTEGVTMYATVGASAWPIVGRAASHRVEYFLGLLPACDDVASAFAALGLYAAREGVEVDHGHTVPAGGSLWPGTGMSAFLVVRPLADFLPPFEMPDAHVDFLQAIPLYESERAFKAVHGAEALLERWERAGVPFWDPRRVANP